MEIKTCLRQISDALTFVDSLITTNLLLPETVWHRSIPSVYFKTVEKRFVRGRSRTRYFLCAILLLALMVIYLRLKRAARARRRQKNRQFLFSDVDLVASFEMAENNRLITLFLASSSKFSLLEK